MTLPAQKRISSIVSQFRNYDLCVRDWLSTFPTDDQGSPIPVVSATPDRAFSAMNLLLKLKGLGNGETPIKNIPLPFISVASGDLSFDPSRFHGQVDVFLGRTKDNTASYSVRHPIPYNINYRAEFWTKNMEPMNAFKFWWAADALPGHENFLTVDLSNVWPFWKAKLVPLENRGMKFVGELEPAEGHRVIRMVADFTLKAWIIPPITTTKNVHKIILDMYLAKTQTDISAVTGTEVDDNPALFENVGHFEEE